MARTGLLVGALFILGFLACLAIRVVVTNGIDGFVIISLVILVVLGVGVLGALTSPDE